MSSQLLMDIVTGAIVTGVVAVFVFLTLSISRKNSPISTDFFIKDESLVDAIDQLLPQTQCGECSYSGCRSYAEAVSDGFAEINQCPPGGSETIAQLADLLGRDIIPLNSEHGECRPFRLAVIDEDECIGCTKCILACPVDAILGAAKQMHTVIAQYCTGCELCIPPCPVDCIDMLPVAYSYESKDSKCHEKAA